MGGSGNFRMWGLAKGSRSLEMDAWEHLVIGPFLSLTLLPAYSKVNSRLCHILSSARCSPQMHEVQQPLSVAKANSSNT